MKEHKQKQIKNSQNYCHLPKSISKFFLKIVKHFFNMKCCFIFPDFIGSIIIAIFNIIIGIADLCMMAKAYSNLEEMTFIENVSLLVSVVFIFLQ